MSLTDLNGPMSVQPGITGSGRNALGRFSVSAILVLSFATFGAGLTRAQEQQDAKPQQDQSVAEAARQERARKQEKQKSAKHVYTEEDLKHPVILTPEDRAQIEAKRNECAQKNNCAPAAPQTPATLDANSPASGTPAGPETSLGEIARELRMQKELQALKPKQTEPFHLPVDAPAFALPIFPGVLPIQPSAEPPRPKISSPKFLSPKIPSRKIFPANPPANIFRRDPFSGMPAPPELRRPEVPRPEINGDVRPNLPANAHRKMAGAGALTISGDARPKVGNDLLPVVPPASVRPDFSQAVRPTLRAHQVTVAPQPKISSRFAIPKIFAEPIALSAPLAPVQPATPVTQPVQPAAPEIAVRPTAPPVPAATSQPAGTQQHTVNVRRGDSLWKLAQENLGRGNRWRELVAANPAIVDPNQIRAGAQLVLPAASASDRRSASSGATIKVRKGDTLWALAKSNLGRSSAWPCLAAANPSLSDPNRIYENQELLVPSSCQP